MQPRCLPLIGLTLAAIALGLAPTASAAEVRSGISTRETYVGAPVLFQIQVSNATKSDPPTIPTVDGLAIKSLGTPSRSTQTTIINGEVSSRSSVTYTYEITPQRPGSFRIPSIAIEADGRVEQTRAFDFVASKSETGDLLFVEIAGKEKQIFVGQAIDLTLRIWLRPYHDKDHDITLSEADMWQLLAQRTTFGPFEEQIRNLAESRQRPAGKEVLRKDRDGVEHSYYLYEIDATIYPKKPGRIDSGDVQIVVDYPTGLGQSRDPFVGFFDNMSSLGGRGGMFDESMFAPFGSRLTVESVRPVVAEVLVEPIEVREIPVAGRPADYRGAVGQYRIITEADPSSVKAGDPINLRIGIAGTGPMELVQAPPLAELPALTADFKVPNEPLAGFVKGGRKVFSTSIRPRQAGVESIPSIPFTYFDPATEKFVTVRSKPIKIEVAPADTLALDDVVGRSSSATSADIVVKTSTTDGSPNLAVYSGDDVLRSESPPQMISPTTVGWLLLPPLAVVGLLLARSSRSLVVLAGRFGSGVRKCKSQIERAQQPSEIAAALRMLLAKRFALGGNLADASLVGALRSAGSRKTAVGCERLFEQCASRRSSSSLGDLQREALQLVTDLQQTAKRQRPAAVRLATRGAAMIALVAGSVFVSAATANSANLPGANAGLTVDQQRTLLTEANDRYQVGIEKSQSDSAEGKQAFADAAEKFQLLVDSGVHSSRLYLNLANAEFEGGNVGRAIADYRRALRLDPTNGDARTNLAFAEKALTSSKTDNTAIAARSFTSLASSANDWLNRGISPRAMLITASVAWLAFWAAIGLRLANVCFGWKSVAVAALVLTTVTATSYTLSCQAAVRPMAIVVATDASLQVGDGHNFAKVDGAKLEVGQTVEFGRRRGGWLQVRTADGQTGWLPESDAEIL